MVGVYRTSWFEATFAGLILKGPNFLLPNIVAGRRIVPEFVPYAGGAEPVARAALALIEDRALIERTTKDLRQVAGRFLGRDPAPIAADVLARAVAGERLGNAELDAIVAAHR